MKEAIGNSKGPQQFGPPAVILKTGDSRCYLGLCYFVIPQKLVSVVPGRDGPHAGES